MANRFFNRLFRRENKLTKAWGKVCKFFKGLTESIKDLFCFKKENKEYFNHFNPSQYAKDKAQNLSRKMGKLKDNVGNIRFARAEHRKFRRSAHCRHLSEHYVTIMPTLLEEARVERTHVELMRGDIPP